MSYDEKINAAYGGKLPGHMRDYLNEAAPKLNKYGLPADKLDIDAMKFGKYDVNQPMAFGTGSVFGESSGSTASSKTVQKSLLEMMGQYYGKYDYTPDQASSAAFSNFYPTIDKYDFSGPPGSEYTKKGYGNLMPQASSLEKFTQNFPDHYTMEEVFKYDPNRYAQKYGYGSSGGGGGGGGGGGWGGYGGGGGGGGGGGYGYPAGQGQQPRGYQRAKVGPGNLQEQVNQAFLGMSGMNQAPGMQKKRGGIVSLLGLRS